MLEPIKAWIRRQTFSPYGWKGDFVNWTAAASHAGTYDDPGILEKVKSATLQVIQGKAAYERDSVLFYEPRYNWPLLSAILWAALQQQGRIRVADFGGALGSTYFQHKKFLDTLSDLHWNSVEQPHFVASGNAIVSDRRLRFFNSLDQLIAEEGRPDILILSCVLPYLESPFSFLESVMPYAFPYILIDNTYFNGENRNRITVQRVPPSIYPASYPCWFLNFSEVKNCFQKNYDILSVHQNESVIFLDGKRIPYQGLLAKKKP